ncbi:hypothetical protein [Rhodococcus marinonascens]|uniref:hypothetical protein n=1 Tax=Rhodococcus marinonascens TaxID=38311 RepID=UPI000933A34A|nr:hypothetical protein [Rhodococcus marinonascens]
MTAEIQAHTDADLAYQAVMLKTILDLVTVRFKAVKAIADEQFPKGASIPARQNIDGQDVKLGRVIKADPKPIAKIVDRDKFHEALRTLHPEDLNVTVQLGDTAEIAAVLADHGREDLFTVVEVVPEWMEAAKLREALAGRSYPGVEVVTPGGVVSARAEEAAKDLVRELLSGSTVPLLAIEGGAA